MLNVITKWRNVTSCGFLSSANWGTEWLKHFFNHLTVVRSSLLLRTDTKSSKMKRKPHSMGGSMNDIQWVFDTYYGKAIYCSNNDELLEIWTIIMELTEDSHNDSIFDGVPQSKATCSPFICRQKIRNKTKNIERGWLVRGLKGRNVVDSEHDSVMLLFLFSVQYCHGFAGFLECDDSHVRTFRLDICAFNHR